MNTLFSFHVITILKLNSTERKTYIHIRGKEGERGEKQRGEGRGKVKGEEFKSGL